MAQSKRLKSSAHCRAALLNAAAVHKTSFSTLDIVLFLINYIKADSSPPYTNYSNIQQGLWKRVNCL